ncbi:hypothetical protein PPERSA_05275 [Pseudocohnilembus persalinus]|uniref:Ubiquitin-like domain-containing protein n=1 Tax=Pseudocohnilembus persalinus TaxID=266149 RepID=A0A0V0R5Y3_PSEPJ|nr:hypothetical protein PPERSA_05275 [Pseudocohnilembus persalinus]|eukprot:KRX09883.1 hypothetical protein PPERSA_05275 [Pseudocohnilembus persalinus]
MGGACTKTSENQVMQPQTQVDYAMNSEFAPFLNITHPFNVNNKYISFCIYNKNEFTGSGIKRTHSYKVKVTKEQLERKRQEFWETRVEGKQQTWQALKSAVESDEKLAIGLLAAAGIKLVNRSIQISYDDTGHKYDIPVFCINDPYSCEAEPPTEKGLNKQFNQKQIEIIMRCSKLEGKDVKRNIDNSTSIKDLKDDFAKELEGQKYEKLRFFVSGRELMDHHLIGFYENQIKDGTIITVFAN